MNKVLILLTTVLVFVGVQALGSHFTGISGAVTAPLDEITIPIETPRCSTEVKICPDGSTVMRILPSCEFAACPEFDPEPLPEPVPQQESIIEKPRRYSGGGGGSGSNPEPEPEPLPEPQPDPEPEPEPQSKNTILGIEYAFPGQASALSELGITGVKFFPELYTMWDVMQGGPNESIDFSNLDAMVLEYQTAGFSDIIFGVRHQSTWGSIAATKLTVANPLPKPEYQQMYEAWWHTVVERYDGDGVDDMPGLIYPINNYEIGVEFSSYEPEDVNAYVDHLGIAYQIAHDANVNAHVAHAAFLTFGALDRNITSDEYETAFDTMQDQTHSLKDIRIILDHPESFDMLNVHSLGDPNEIPRIKAFFSSEMQHRGYDKPIIISDTSPTPFIAYGPADTCTGTHGVLFYPATEQDLCKLADYFTELIAKDAETTAWTRAFIAADIVKRATIASEQGIQQIDLAFTEDMNEFIFKQLLHAGTGNAAWGGLLETSVQPGSEHRTIIGKYPAFYALQQLQQHLGVYDSIEKMSIDNNIYVYKFTNESETFYIAWLDDGKLRLPEDDVPFQTIQLGNGSAIIEHLITQDGQTVPYITHEDLNNITITPIPEFIFVSQSTFPSSGIVTACEEVTGNESCIWQYKVDSCLQNCDKLLIFFSGGEMNCNLDYAQNILTSYADDGYIATCVELFETADEAGRYPYVNEAERVDASIRDIMHHPIITSRWNGKDLLISGVSHGATAPVIAMAMTTYDEQWKGTDHTGACFYDGSYHVQQQLQFIDNNSCHEINQIDKPVLSYEHMMTRYCGSDILCDNFDNISANDTITEINATEYSISQWKLFSCGTGADLACSLDVMPSQPIEQVCSMLNDQHHVCEYIDLPAPEYTHLNCAQDRITDCKIWFNDITQTESE